MKISIMPPYVKPKNRKLLQDAENMLKEYEQNLTERLMREPPICSNINRSMEDTRRAKSLFHDDPFRKVLVDQLCKIKNLVEIPRLMVDDKDGMAEIFKPKAIKGG